MPIARFSFSICLFFIFSLGDVLPIRSQEYVTYCNQRYGFCVDYPVSFKTGTPPDNGDGSDFFDGNGFMMTASGINNVSDDTLESEIITQSESFDEITYHKKDKNWFVLSGFRGSDVLYLKTFIGTESINHLSIRYPASHKAIYDSIVDKISHSYRPGDIRTAH